MMNSKTTTPYGFNPIMLRTTEERQKARQIAPQKLRPLSKQKAISRYIEKIEKMVKKMDDHNTYKEYWKLGMFLIQHGRKNQGLEYLKYAIEFKQDGQYSSVYHEQGVYNEMYDNMHKKQRHL